MNFRANTVHYRKCILVFFFSRTNLENLADHKWSADRTLGNTGLTVHNTYKQLWKLWNLKSPQKSRRIKNKIENINQNSETKDQNSKNYFDQIKNCQSSKQIAIFDLDQKIEILKRHKTDFWSSVKCQFWTSANL